MKPYVFNGTVYNDLNSLALAYIDDFNDGVEDIYINAKKLVKFVKDVTKNKELVKEVVSILAYSKYKNNALTFIIFTFLDEKKVYINGKEFTYEQYVEELKAYPDITNNNVLYAFMEDYGISKTFAQLDDSSKAIEDSFFIEKNYKDLFTYKFITTYDGYHVDEAPYAKLSTIAVNGEECFRRASKVAYDEDFQLGLAHRVGFKLAVEMHNEVNPLFKAIKLLRIRKEVEDNQLKKLIVDTFYWWLLDNLDKYLAVKNEAKETFVRLLEIKAEFQSYKDKILRKEITDISLDLYADISRSLYLNYLNFVTLFRDGKIIVKKRFDESQYSFDKPYCKTYITTDFMKNHIVKLYNPNKDEDKVISLNPLTGAQIFEEEQTTKEIDVDDISDDKPVLVHIDDENILKDIEVAKKVYSKNIRLAKFSIGTAIINAILVIGFAIAAMLLKDQNFGSFSTALKNVNTVAIILIVLSGIALLAVLGFGNALNILSKKRYADANTLLFITNAKTKDKISPKQESRLITLLINENDYKYQIKKRYKNFRLATAVLQAVSFALVGIVLAIVLGVFVSVFKFKPQVVSVVLAALAGPLVASIIVIFKKKNGVLSILLMDIIAIVAVIIFAILGV